MKRKQFRTICENIEWLESPENHGLVIPFHRLFTPNLSKSAPCNCCGQAPPYTCNNCKCCTDVLPPLKLTDSIYGGPVNLINSVATNTNVQIYGAANCSQPTTCSTITTTLTYTLSCHPGTPPYLTIAVSYYWCCSQIAIATGPPCSSFIGSQHLNISNLDCFYPNLVFTIPATAGTNPYSNTGGGSNCFPSTGGATITITSQSGSNPCVSCFNSIGTGNLSLLDSHFGGGVPVVLTYDSTNRWWDGPWYNTPTRFRYHFWCGYAGPGLGSPYGLYTGIWDNNSGTVTCVSSPLSISGCSSTPSWIFDVSGMSGCGYTTGDIFTVT